MKYRHFYLGITVWLGLAIAGWLTVYGTDAHDQQSIGGIVGGIRKWVSGARSEWTAVAGQDLMLGCGDPILMGKPDGSFHQIGVVRNNFASNPKEGFTRKASVLLYKDVTSSCPDGFVLEYHTTPTALDWVVRTMVPPNRQREIAQLIADDWKSHREDVMEQLQPVVEKSLALSINAIEGQMPTTIENHREDFGKLADRYQREIIRRQIVPIVRQEILPIIEEEVTPTARELGQVLWDRVSLWSFTWRYIYDVSPLPEKNAVKSEFSRFLEQEIRPELEARSDQFVAITQRIIARVSRNERVKHVVRENLHKVTSDPELQAIIWSVVQESILENASLRSNLGEYWKSAEVQDALQVANVRFEPTARAIGDAIFGSREKGITPEFSRVLRSQILLKDRRWLVAVPVTSVPAESHPFDSDIAGHVANDELKIVVAAEPMEFPIEFEGTAQSPLTQTASPEPVRN